MKIKSLKINGFGIFSNLRVENISPGLSVFTGLNESGKSTFMRFIRSCLFGMKGKRGSIDEPLRGGHHGGTMDINLSDGSSQKLILSGRKLYVQDDSLEKVLFDEGPPWLGMGRNLFEKIFCIGLEELSWGGSMLLDEEYVRNRLFSATAGLGEVSLMDVFSSLSDEMGRLLKTRSNSSSVLGDLKSRLLETEKQLNDLGNSEEHYSDLKNSRTDLEKRIVELTARIETTRKDLKGYKKLESLLEPWNSLKITREEEVKLSGAAGFPTMGEHRYMEIKKQLKALEGEITVKKDSLKKKKSELVSLDINEEIFRLEEKIEKLRDERTILAGIPEKIALLKKKCEEGEKKLSPLLLEISPSWGITELVKADLAEEALREARYFAEKETELESRIFSSRELLRSMKEEKDRIFEAYQRSRESVLEYYREIPEKADLEARVSEMDELRDLVVERNQLFERSSSMEKTLLEVDAELKQVESKIKKLSPPMSKKVIYSTSAILFAVAISAFAAAGTMTGIFTAAICFLLLAAFFAFNRQRRRGYERHKGELEAEASVMKEKQAEKRDSLTEMNRELDSMDIRIKELSAFFEISLPETEEEIQGFRFSLKRIFTKLRTVMDHVEDIQRAHADLQYRISLVEEKENVRLTLEKEKEKLLKEWGSWLADHNLPVDTRPSEFSRLEQNIRYAKRILFRIEEETDEMEIIMDSYSEKENEVDTLFSQLGLPEQNDSSLIRKVDLLVYRLRENRDLLGKKQNLEENISKLETDLEASEKAYSGYVAKRQDLLEIAGASNEEEFFLRSRDSNRLEELKQRSIQLRSRLSGIAGSEKDLEGLLEELEKKDSLEIKSTIESLENRLDVLEQDGASLQKELGAVENRLRDISVDKTRTKLMQEKEFLLTEADQVSKRWIKLALARRMLENARGKYERERQPEVVNLADRYMQIVTGGRYGLLSSIEDRRIVLSSVQGNERKEQIQWSSGLADQAYICIRLALAAVFAGLSEPLPLVLDDIHVRFDYQRQEGLAEVLLELSREHQVLFFSCSPYFRRVLQQKINQDSSEILPGFYTLQDGEIFDDSLQIGSRG